MTPRTQIKRVQGKTINEAAAYYEPFQKAYPRPYPCPECEYMIVLQPDTVQVLDKPEVQSYFHAACKTRWPFSCAFRCIAEDCQKTFSCRGLMTVDYAIPGRILDHLRQIGEGSESPTMWLPNPSPVEVPVRQLYQPLSFEWEDHRLSLEYRVLDAGSGRLRSRHWSCLKAVAKLDAGGKRVPAQKVADAIQKGSGPESVRESMKDLVDWGFLRSEVGRKGGYFLTNAGRRALRLRGSMLTNKG